MEWQALGGSGTRAISIHALNRVAVAKSIDIEFVYIHHAKAKLSKLLIKTVILKSVTLRWVFKLLMAKRRYYPIKYLFFAMYLKSCGR